MLVAYFGELAPMIQRRVRRRGAGLRRRPDLRDLQQGGRPARPRAARRAGRARAAAGRGRDRAPAIPTGRASASASTPARCSPASSATAATASTASSATRSTSARGSRARRRAGGVVIGAATLDAAARPGADVERVEPTCRSRASRSRSSPTSCTGCRDFESLDYVYVPTDDVAGRRSATSTTSARSSCGACAAWAPSSRACASRATGPRSCSAGILRADADPRLPGRRLRRGDRAAPRRRRRRAPRARDPAGAVRELPHAGRPAARDLRAQAARRGGPFHRPHRRLSCLVYAGRAAPGRIECQAEPRRASPTLLPLVVLDLHVPSGLVDPNSKSTAIELSCAK